MPEKYDYHQHRIRVLVYPGENVELQFTLGTDSGGDIAYRILDAGEARQLGHALLRAAQVSAGVKGTTHDGSVDDCHICRMVRLANEMTAEDWKGEHD